MSRLHLKSPVRYVYSLRKREKFEKSFMPLVEKMMDSLFTSNDHQTWMSYRKELYALPVCNYECNNCLDMCEYVDLPRKQTIYDTIVPKLFPNDTNYELDFLSFYFFLALGNVSESHVKDWIIENESLLLLKRYNYYLFSRTDKLKASELENIIFEGYIRKAGDITDIPVNYYSNNDPEKIEQNPEFMIMKNNVRIHWTFISSNAFNWKQVNMVGGWISIPNKYFQKNIALFIENSAKRLFEKEVYVEKSIDAHTKQTLQEISHFYFSGEVAKRNKNRQTTESLSTIFQLSPLCIQELDFTFSEIGINDYIRILQLSLYLKQFIPSEDLLEYFYERGAGNAIYPSFNAYKSANADIVYHVRHQYGESGGTDYQPMSCKKCQNEGFCFYQMPVDTIEKYLYEKYKTNLELNFDAMKPKIDKIIYWCKSYKPSNACALELSIRYSKSIKEINKLLSNLIKVRKKTVRKTPRKEFKNPAIYHPMAYYDVALICRKELEEQSQNTNEAQNEIDEYDALLNQLQEDD